MATKKNGHNWGENFTPKKMELMIWALAPQ